MARLALRNIVDVFHPLVKRLALDRSLAGYSGDVAQKLRHFLVNGVGLPALPTDFEVGKEGGVIEREEIVAFDVGRQEPIIGVVNPGFSAFLDGE